MTLAQLRRLADRRRRADEAWRRGVVEACSSSSMRQVAVAGGITAGRVAQIVREERERAER